MHLAYIFYLLVFCEILSSDAFQSKAPSNRRSEGRWTALAASQSTKDGPRFFNPLLEYGYRPAVEEYNVQQSNTKPILIYLPGFDGTFLSPFLQFPELSTVFDISCLTVPTTDRSTYEELRSFVIQHIETITSSTTTTKTNIFGRKPKRRPIYLAGESFGGILASDIALDLQKGDVALKGMCLINPATSFDRSRLASEGPPVAKLNPLLFPLGALRLLSLFTDEYSLQQLLLILQAKRLPSVVNTAAREAYMGRVAFSLPSILPIVTPKVLDWRLNEWLFTGCARMSTRINDFQGSDLQTLVVVGENDQTLPSIAEAARLTDIFKKIKVHVVPGAGHASTCGSRVDLAALFRSTFPELRTKQDRTEMLQEASNGEGAYYGMVPRYDNATIGLSPLLYWSSEYYLTPNATIS